MDLGGVRVPLKHGQEKRDHAMLKLALALARSEVATVKDVHQELVALCSAIKAPSIWNYGDMEPFLATLSDPAAMLMQAWIGAVKQQPDADPGSALAGYLGASER